MSVPGRVQTRLGDEEVVARVPLGSDETLYTTPSRTIIHREGTFLKDESVEEFSNSVERLSLREGRRKSRLEFVYASQEDRELTVAKRSIESVLPTVLNGVLAATNVLDAPESVIQSYRFNELTVVVTNQRLLKHVGSAVWDADFESLHFEDVTGLRVEKGSVATQIVLESTAGTERLKVPRDDSRSLREHLERAICAFHDVDSIAELRATSGVEAPEEDAEANQLSDELEPLRTDFEGEEDQIADDGFDSSPFEPAANLDGDLEEQLASLRETLQRQAELLEHQTQMLERIEQALTRDR